MLSLPSPKGLIRACEAVSDPQMKGVLMLLQPSRSHWGLLRISDLWTKLNEGN